MEWPTPTRHPRPLVERAIDALPHQFGRALAPGMAELQGKFRRRIGVDEIDDAAPGSFLRIIPQPGTTRRDASIAPDTRHLGEDQPGTADRTRSIVDQMEITRHALVRRIHAHRRHHGAIGNLHVAQAEWLKHRRERLFDIDVKSLGAYLPGKRLIDLGNEIGRP